jgi:hypothetical protein
VALVAGPTEPLHDLERVFIGTGLTAVLGEHREGAGLPVQPVGRRLTTGRAGGGVPGRAPAAG